MASRTLVNGRLYARELYLDTDTNNPAISDTELNRLANRNYRWLYTKFSARARAESSTVLGATFLVNIKSIYLGLSTIAQIKQVYRTSSTLFSVTNCSVTADYVTLTTTDSFASPSQVLAGMQVFHANLPTGTFVRSYDSAGAVTLSDQAVTTITNGSVSFRPTTGAPIKQDGYSRIVELQNAETTVGTPIICGFRRAQAATVSSTLGVGSNAADNSIGLIEMAVWPIPSTTFYFPMTVRHEVTEMSADADRMDLQDSDDDVVWEMTAAMAARLIGRQPISEELIKGLPDTVRESAGQVVRSVQPGLSQVLPVHG